MNADEKQRLYPRSSAANNRSSVLWDWIAPIEGVGVDVRGHYPLVYHAAPDHEKSPLGLRLENFGRRRSSHFAERDGFPVGQRHDFVVVPLAQLPVVVVAHDIGELLAGEEIGELASGGGAVLVPHPNQVVQVMDVHHARVHLSVELRGAGRPRTAAPPEEAAVILMHGPPQDRDMRVPKLLQILRRTVHILLPSLVQRRVGRDQLGPLLIGELGLHAAAPTRARLPRFILGGPQHVPAQVDNGSGGGLLLGFLDHKVAVLDGVLVLAVRKPEIRTPDGGKLAGKRIYLVGVLGTLIRKIVLAGQDALARDGAERFQQRAGLRRGIRIHRIAVIRRRCRSPARGLNLVCRLSQLRRRRRSLLRSGWGRGGLSEKDGCRSKQDRQGGECGFPHCGYPRRPLVAQCTRSKNVRPRMNTTRQNKAGGRFIRVNSCSFVATNVLFSRLLGPQNGTSSSVMPWLNSSTGAAAAAGCGRFRAERGMDTGRS